MDINDFPTYDKEGSIRHMTTCHMQKITKKFKIELQIYFYFSISNQTFRLCLGQPHPLVPLLLNVKNKTPPPVHVNVVEVKSHRQSTLVGGGCCSPLGTDKKGVSVKNELHPENQHRT